MYYDPMIAKLCTWAPTGGRRSRRCATALDRFEVEGIGHNLPFLSAVMDHPRFVEGGITTAFIAEEYPEGFQGVTLPEPMLRRVAARGGGDAPGRRDPPRRGSRGRWTTTSAGSAPTGW